MSESVSVTGTPQRQQIDADLETLAEHERQYGHLRLPDPMDGLSELGRARYRLADAVPSLLAVVEELTEKNERLHANWLRAAESWRSDAVQVVELTEQNVELQAQDERNLAELVRVRAELEATRAEIEKAVLSLRPRHPSDRTMQHLSNALAGGVAAGVDWQGLDLILGSCEPPTWKPGDPCANCGSTATNWDAELGGYCANCGKADSDE